MSARLLHLAEVAVLEEEGLPARAVIRCRACGGRVASRTIRNLSEAQGEWATHLRLEHAGDDQ